MLFLYQVSGSHIFRGPCSFCFFSYHCLDLTTSIPSHKEVARPTLALALLSSLYPSLALSLFCVQPGLSANCVSHFVPRV